MGAERERERDRERERERENLRGQKKPVTTAVVKASFRMLCAEMP